MPLERATNSEQNCKFTDFVFLVWPVPPQNLNTRSDKIVRCCVKVLRAFGQALRVRLETKLASKLRCCVEVLHAFGQAARVRLGTSLA